MATTTARKTASRTSARPNGRVAAAGLFHALSDETRLAVLEMLGTGERCVCDLQDALDAAQSRLSFHLKVLKDAGLVTDRKEGRWSYYALVAERLAEGRAYLGVLATPRPAGSPTLVPLQRAVRRASAGSRPARRAISAARAGDACCD